MFTSHVLFAFEYYEGVAAVGFTFLVALLVRVSVGNEADLAPC